MTGDNCAALFDIVKILLVLSHGQASVERGFSVKKEIEVGNLHEHSLVAQLIICDLKAVGGVLSVPITKKFLATAASSRQKYEKRQGTKRDKKKTDEEQRKRKHVLMRLRSSRRRRKR